MHIINHNIFPHLVQTKVKQQQQQQQQQQQKQQKQAQKKNKQTKKTTKAGQEVEDKLPKQQRTKLRQAKFLRTDYIANNWDDEHHCTV